MKKIIYLFAVALTVLSSCTPLEDVNEVIDALPNVDAFDYTLQDDDYETLGLNFGNFSSEDDAKAEIPGFLSTKFPSLGEGSALNITYKLYAPKRDEKSLTIYTVTAADYTAQGLRFPNFSSFDQITDFLDAKYPDAANRLLVDLTYDYYDGSVSTLNNGFINNDGTWEMSIGISDDEYTAMGEGRAQFSNEDEALTKIPVYLSEKLKFEGKEAGDIEGVMYKLYVTDTQDIDEDGSVTDRTVYSFVAFFIYDGAAWSQYTNVIENTTQFAYEGSNWVPDNTIRYTLTSADYALVGNDRYNNFDVRSGADEETEEVRLEKINTILKNNFPDIEVDQNVIVTYAFYDGTNGNATIEVTFDGTDFIKFVE
ncbi:hypothetical protein [uncultured Polaribacter sp.]|uniref:hypothetical protein n=1 Tax=uncultured Polaribacter sp. TaxID=174711 RepID=UPI002611C7C6|nr:hypothetical protein [uncultured Polaribacter sp.]